MKRLLYGGAVIALLIELTLVIYRDAVRDLSLLAKGFDVWNRAVVTNWRGSSSGRAIA